MWFLTIFKDFNTDVLVSSGSASSYYLFILIYYNDGILIRSFSLLLIFL
jgi:hypothetical protein